MKESNLRSIFGDSAVLKLLQVLRDNPEKSFSKKELAEEARVARSTVHRVWERLEQIDAVEEDSKYNRTQLYSFNRDSKPVKKLFEIEEELGKDRENGKPLEYKFSEKEPELSEYFEGQEEVELAYLFGSVAEGSENKFSDVDFAVLLEESERSVKTKLKILGSLKEILGFEDIDLVILNDTSLKMSYNVVSTGKMIYKSKENRKAEFELRTVREYLDMKHYIDRHTDSKLNQFAERGLA